MGALFLILAVFVTIAALYFPDFYGQIEAESDFKKFKKNGSRDTLKFWFHFFGALERFVFLLGVEASFCVVLFGDISKCWGVALSAFVCGAAVFGLRFTPTLNQLRGLNAWYVSRDKNASFTDRFFVWSGRVSGKEPETVSFFLHRCFAALAVVQLLATVGIKIYLL